MAAMESPTTRFESLSKRTHTTTAFSFARAVVDDKMNAYDGA